jgi:prepilin-type N-terminal cleavage/methylation domain-containing protein
MKNSCLFACHAEGRRGDRKRSVLAAQGSPKFGEHFTKCGERSRAGGALLTITGITYPPKKMTQNKSKSLACSRWSIIRADARITDHHSVRARQRDPESIRGFTLLELLIVVGIIAVLLVLTAPAFTYIKGGTDVTNAAYTIKGVLDTARTYAKANNTYTWVGFYEEDASQPSTNPARAGIGRIVMSIVASKDGTTVYDPNNLSAIDPTKLIQVGKLTKIDNAHLWTHTDQPSATGTTPLDRRQNVLPAYCVGDTSPATDSTTPFQYPVGIPAPAAQYTFLKAVQFSPGGEARIDNSSYPLQTVAEIGMRPTHATAVDATSPNVVAIQFTGVGANVTIYQR